MRQASIMRKTKETNIAIKLNLDGTGRSIITCDLGFFAHMLETVSRHGLFDITARLRGDIHVDQHHVVEDTGIALGEAFGKALSSKRGIARAGYFLFPMDETLASAAIDISGRPYLKLDARFRNKRCGDFNLELLSDFFKGFTDALRATLHIKVHYGRSDHHKAEAIFKAFAKALRQACSREARGKNVIPSTKGRV